MSLPAWLLREAFEDPLRLLGFNRVNRRQVWMRRAAGIEHAVSLESGSGSWSVRWDIVHPAVGELLHGRRAEPSAVRYTGFISGTAQAALLPGVTAHFKPQDLEDRTLAQGVALAATQVAEWTGDFTTKRQAIDFLTQEPGDKLRDPRVTVPVNWPLRLFTAAALAAVEGEPDAPDLAERAIDVMGAGSQPTDARAQRLRAALA